MTSTAFAILVRPPPDAVICKVKEPVWTLPGRVTVRIELKLGVPDGTVNTGLTPAGAPETDNETCELNPFRPEMLTE